LEQEERHATTIANKTSFFMRQINPKQPELVHLSSYFAIYKNRVSQFLKFPFFISIKPRPHFGPYGPSF
jgi:sensor histidine kinase YesM